MGLISNATRERVRERIDMVQLVSEYVQLQPRGPDDLWGRCPFHEERSPSFHIRPTRGLFKCFGCGKGGDVFRFIEELEGLSFPEAVRRLAQRAGVRIEDASPEERAREDRRAELARASELVAGFFEEVLWSATPVGDRGRSYLASRGLSEETARAFRMGVAPPEPEALRAFARGRGLAPEVLLELGLLRERDGQRYAFFRDRLMFPIADEQGKVIAFGGRTLGDDPRKYMNSREVPGFYEKRRHLYGLDKAKKARPKRLVVVEGYMDVVGPHQAGRREFVAALGTAFTPEQAKLARRYVDEVVLLFDGDDAGQAATQRALANLVGEQHLTLKVARLPAGLDPDEVVRRDPQELDRILDESDDVVGFLIDSALAGWDVASAAGQERAVRAAIRLLARIPDEIRLGIEMGAISERFGLPEQLLRDELVRARRQATQGGGSSARRGSKRDADDPGASNLSGTRNALPGKGLEQHLLEALLAVPHGVARVEERGLTTGMFSAGPTRRVAEAIFQDAAANGAVDAARVLGRIDEAPARDLASRLLGRIHEAKQYEDDLAGADRLVRAARKRREQEIKQEIRLAKDRETRDRLLAEFHQLQAQDAPRGVTTGRDGARPSTVPSPT